MQPRPLKVFYNQQQVNNTNCYTYLGHTIEGTLNLNSDFESSYKRVATRLKLLSKLRGYLNQDSAMKIYVATIVPIMRYCLGLKLYLSTTQSSMLTSLERRASRIIGKKVNSIEHEMKKQALLMVWKCLNDIDICNDFKNYFERLNHNNITKNAENTLRLPKCRLEYLKRSFYFLGAKYFNDLPLEIRNETSFSRFNILINKFFKT